MSSTIAIRPEITPTDRLSMTLCLAVLLHGIIVLGITFAPEDDPIPRYDSMEIILVQQQSQPVDDARLLAQASLEGGGDTAQPLSPSTPLPPPFPDEEAAVTAPPAVEPQPQPTETEIIAETAAETSPPVHEVEQLALQSETAELQQQAVVEKQPEPEVTTKQTEQEASPRKRRRPSATALLTNSFKIAALSAEIKQKLEAKAERPKRKFISASTREYKYAAYMEAWRAKVERVGNLNYPEEARKRKISGSLILDVALNPDGSVNQIVIRRSSGQKLLDDAAIRIVELAAPFAPFPSSIDRETDILHITRTWQFLNNRGFR